MALTVDEFRQKIDDTRPRCILCQHRAHSLVRHLKDRHNLSVGQYKKSYPQALVVSRVVTELAKQVKREPVRGAEQPLDNFTGLFTGLAVAAATSDDSLFAAMKTAFWKPTQENLPLVPKTDPHFVLDKEFSRATAYALLKGKNTYVEGPTGCGKTDGVKQIHARLDLACKRVNMNGDVNTANFIGRTHADMQRGTYFKPGSLPQAMKGGYTLLIDEIDYTPPNIAAVLNPVLEGARELYIPETDEHIHAEKGFCVIGTANTGGKGDSTGVYTGTEVQNTAFLDRFTVKLTTDYLSPAQETAMLERRFPNASSARMTQFTLAAKEVRDQFKNGLIPVTLSTRKLIDIFDMEPELGLKMAVECAILNWLDEDNKALVAKIMDNHGITLR